MSHYELLFWGFMIYAVVSGFIIAFKLWKVDMNCKNCTLNHFSFFSGSCTCYCHTGRTPKDELKELL